MQNSLQCDQQSITYILNMGLAGLFKRWSKVLRRRPLLNAARCSPEFSKTY